MSDCDGAAWERACGALASARADAAEAASELARARVRHARALSSRAAAQHAVEQAAACVDWRAVCGRRSFHLPPNVADAVVSCLAGETRTLCALACVDRAFAAAVARSPEVWRVLRVVVPPAPPQNDAPIRACFTDADLARLVARSRGALQELHLDGCTAVTAAGLAPAVRHHETLKLLKLRRCAMDLDGLVRVLRSHRPPGGLPHAFRLEGSIRMSPHVERRYLSLPADSEMRGNVVWDELEKLEPLCSGADELQAACVNCHQLFSEDEEGHCCRGHRCYFYCAACVEDGWQSAPEFVRRLDCTSAYDQRCYTCAVAEVSLDEELLDELPCAYCLSTVQRKDELHPCAKCGAHLCPDCYSCVRWLDAADGDDGIGSEDEQFHDNAHTDNFEDQRDLSLRCGHTRCCGAMLCGVCAPEDLNDADDECGDGRLACADCGVPLCAACLTAQDSAGAPPLRDDEPRYCRECIADSPTIADPDDAAASPGRQAPRRTAAGGPSEALLKATRPRAGGRAALREARSAFAEEHAARRAVRAAGWHGSKRARIGD